MSYVKGGSFLLTETKPQDVFSPEDFTDEQKQIAEMLQKFMENEVIPNVEEI